MLTQKSGRHKAILSTYDMSHICHVRIHARIYGIITVPISVTLPVRINMRCKFGALQCACMVQLHTLAYKHVLSCIIFWLCIRQLQFICIEITIHKLSVKQFESTIIDICSITLDVQLHSYSIVTNHGNPSVAQSFSQREDDQTKAPECINSE